jgi:hypothetical protein
MWAVNTEGAAMANISIHSIKSITASVMHSSSKEYGIDVHMVSLTFSESRSTGNSTEEVTLYFKDAEAADSYAEAINNVHYGLTHGTAETVLQAAE